VFVKNLWIHLEKVFVTQNIINVTAPKLEILSFKSFAICKPFHSFYSQMRLKYIIKHTVILKSEMLLHQLVVLRESHPLKLWLKVSSFFISPVISIVYWSDWDNLASKWWLSSCWLWFCTVAHFKRLPLLAGLAWKSRKNYLWNFLYFHSGTVKVLTLLTFVAWQPKSVLVPVNPWRWNHYLPMSENT